MVPQRSVGRRILADWAAPARQKCAGVHIQLEKHFQDPSRPRTSLHITKLARSNVVFMIAKITENIFSAERSICCNFHVND